MRKFKDERITIETHRIASPMYFLTLFLTALMVTVKLWFWFPFRFYIADIICVGSTLLFLVIRYAWRGILFSSETDENILAYKRQTKSICFYIYMVGYLIYVILILYIFPIEQQRFTKSSLFVLGHGVVMMIPLLIYVVHCVRNGVYTLGNNPDKKKSMRFLRVLTPFMALAFGIVTCWRSFTTHSLPVAILTTLLISFLWGVPMYFIEKAAYNRSQKNADKRVENAEREDTYDGEDTP